MAQARDAPEPVKIGAGHLAGMGRQGLRELRAAMYPESNVAQQPDLGIVGNATPGEVAEARRADEYARDVERFEQEGGSVVADRLQKAEKEADARGVHGRESKGLEKE